MNGYYDGMVRYVADRYRSEGREAAERRALNLERNAGLDAGKLMAAARAMLTEKEL